MTRVPDPLPAATEPRADREGRPAGRALAAAIACLLAVGVTSHALRIVDARSGALPEIANFSDKLEFWRGHSAAFDVLLFGTSSVLRGIDPAVFDAETARLGTPTRTFNASVPGLNFADQHFFLKRYLDAAGPRLAWVIVEPNTRVSLVYSNVTKERVVIVHDPRNTWALLRLTWALPSELRRKIFYSANHTLAGSYWLLNAGSLARRLFGARPSARAPDLANTLGFESIEAAYPDEIEQRRITFALLVRSMANGWFKGVPPAATGAKLPAVATRRFFAIAADVEQRAALGWLIMPYFGSSRSARFRNTFAEGAMPGELFDLESPGLPDPRFFSDRTHLNAQGARHFSRVLARSFAAARSRRD